MQRSPLTYTAYIVVNRGGAASGTVHYTISARAGREHLTDVLDAAAEGRPASVSRGQAERTQRSTRTVCRLSFDFVRPARRKFPRRTHGRSVFIPGLPIAADGATLDEALDETVLALRVTMQDAWSERLHRVPNPCRQLGPSAGRRIFSDDQLKVWLHEESEIPAPTRKDHQKFCVIEGWVPTRPLAGRPEHIT